MGIYLDHAATTFLSPLEASEAYMQDLMSAGNPSSLHDKGKQAKDEIENARKLIADCLGAYSEEIYFTSGGTESNNLAIEGIVPYLRRKDKTTIITSQIEHHSVLNVCKKLESDGFKVIYMPVNGDGCVDIEELDKVMQENLETLGLVSIMAVNNEIGSIQLLNDIGELCEENHVIFHVDGVQAFGKLRINVKDYHIDMFSLSGHKFNAPKGVGALYVANKDFEIQPLIYGGGQEKGLRSGTENVLGIVCMGHVAEKVYKTMDLCNEIVTSRRDEFLNVLDANNVDYKINGDGGLPHILSLTFDGCESNTLLAVLNRYGVYVSGGSACSASSLIPSHVLKAIGLSDREALSTIRVSFGWENTTWEVSEAANILALSVKKLRVLAKELVNENQDVD